MYQNIKSLVEKGAFGVFTFWGERLGISIAAIRMYFIYLSCITLGSPIVVYLVVAFLMNIHKYLRNKRRTIWDV